MKNQSFCLVVTCVSLMAARHPAFSMSDDFRQEYVKAHAEVTNPSRYFKSEEWGVEALFFDLDGNGKTEEALLADPDQRYADGNGWEATRRNPATGELERHPEVGESGIGLHSRSSQLYIVSAADKPDRLYGNDVGIYDIKDFGTANCKQRFYLDDAFLAMDTNGVLCAKSLPNGFGDIVSESGFKRIERAVTEFYSGFDAKLERRSSMAPDVVYAEPRQFRAFVDHYREEVKGRLGISGKVTVLAIFLDADNDGNSDFFVSSDAEERTRGKFDWHLFLNNGDSFVAAPDTIWFNLCNGHCRESLKREETAGPDDFYLVQRSDSKPSVIILDHDGGSFHSRAARRQWLSPPPSKPSGHLSRDQMRDYFRVLEEWRWNHETTHGIVPAFDFEELLVNGNFLRLERLPCSFFPDKSVE